MKNGNDNQSTKSKLRGINNVGKMVNANPKLNKLFERIPTNKFILIYYKQFSGLVVLKKKYHLIRFLVSSFFA